MVGRLHSQNRCKRCRINYLLCFCNEIPSLDLSTQVTILMHKGEIHLPSNTANLAKESLKNSEIRIRGLINAPMDLTDIAADSNYTNLVVFPSEDAISLEIAVKNSTKPIRLIVPDGSWNQAKSTVKREPLLRPMQKVVIPVTGPSQYKLRREPSEESVSTFEAIARSLGVIHGTGVQQALEKIFTIMVERTLWSKNRLHESAAQFPIPKKAIHFRAHPNTKGEDPDDI